MLVRREPHSEVIMASAIAPQRKSPRPLPVASALNRRPPQDLNQRLDGMRLLAFVEESDAHVRCTWVRDATPEQNAKLPSVSPISLIEDGRPSAEHSRGVSRTVPATNYRGGVWWRQKRTPECPGAPGFLVRVSVCLGSRTLTYIEQDRLMLP